MGEGRGDGRDGLDLALRKKKKAREAVRWRQEEVSAIGPEKRPCIEPRPRSHTLTFQGREWTAKATYQSICFVCPSVVRRCAGVNVEKTPARETRPGPNGREDGLERDAKYAYCTMRG